MFLEENLEGFYKKIIFRERIMLEFLGELQEGN